MNAHDVNAEMLSAGLVPVARFSRPDWPALMISVMIVAAITVHWEHGLFASKNGIELALLYAAIAMGLGLTGYGRYSLDAWLGIADWWTAAATWTTLGIGVLGGFANLAIRRRALSLPEVEANANRN